MSFANWFISILKAQEIVKQNKYLLEQNQNLIRENNNLQKYITGDNVLKQTDYKRWIDLNNHHVTWEPRTERIAQIIQPNSTVIEFGAGRKSLLKYLDKSCTYQPSDLVERGENTLVMDLNAPELPAFRNMTTQFSVEW